MSEYLNNIISCLQTISEEAKESLDEVAKKVCETIENDGLIFIFGCGHSHLPGLDSFYRAGGLANVSCMLDTDLMLHNGAAKSSRMEKMTGIGTEIYRRYAISKNDMLILFSLSGKNNVPIEIADNAVKDGIYTVGVSSSSYFNKGAKLHEHVTRHIDCKVPYGDASVDVGSGKMGGLSTAAFCFILNTVLIEGAKSASSHGFDVPIYLSGNVEGGKEHNIELENRYFKRIKHL